jgi:hypothetical protein
MVTEIWVASGAYRPDRGTLNRSSSFPLLSGVAIYGGFAGTESSLVERDPALHIATLSGDLLGNDGPNFANVGDNAHHVVRAVGLDPSAVLDGFTIQGGNASDLGGDNATGGGIFIRNGDATVRNCRLRRNRASFGGAALVNTGAARFIHCMFEQNLAAVAGGAALLQPSATTDFVGCTFLANTAAFQGGALASSLNSNVMGVGCRFLGNAANGFGGGAILNSSSTLFLANCMLSGNVAASPQHGGGAIRNERGDVTLVHCTLAGNSSASAGGGVYNFLEADLTVISSILWGNVDPSGATQAAQVSPGPVAPLLAYCVVQGWDGALGGLTNFAADPLLVDADGADNLLGTLDDDLRLAGCASPAVNSGANDALPPDTFDLDADDDTLEPLPLDLAGAARVFDGRVDPGAFEWTGAGCPCGDLDRSGFASVADLALWGGCLSGPEAAFSGVACGWPSFVAGDCDRDDDVDLRDLAVFQAEF